MDRNDQKMLKDEIKDIMEINIDSKKVVMSSVIDAYIYSLIVFGFKNPITKDVLNIWNEFKKNLTEEYKFCNFFYKNSSVVDLYECLVLLDSITDVNDKLTSYVLDCLDDIIIACQMKSEFRAQHYKRDFKTILETDEYRNLAIGLTISFEDIKKFLNYPKEFWNYISTRIRKVDPLDEKNEILYSTLMKFDDNNKLTDILVLVPYIINLKTSLVNIHEFKHAYDLYNLLGCEVSNDVSVYEMDASNKEKEFTKEYITNKANNLF